MSRRFGKTSPFLAVSTACVVTTPPFLVFPLPPRLRHRLSPRVSAASAAKPQHLPFPLPPRLMLCLAGCPRDPSAVGGAWRTGLADSPAGSGCPVSRAPAVHAANIGYPRGGSLSPPMRSCNRLSVCPFLGDSWGIVGGLVRSVGSACPFFSDRSVHSFASVHSFIFRR